MTKILTHTSLCTSLIIALEMYTCRVGQKECMFLRLLVPTDKLPAVNIVPSYTTTEGLLKVHMLNIYMTS